MIRVTHIISDGNIGGAGVLLCNLLRHADRSTFDLSVIVPEGSSLIPRITALEVPYHTVTGLYDRSAGMRAVPEIARVLRREKPQIVQTHASLSGRVAATLAGVPVRIATRHCAFPPSAFLSAFPGKQLNGSVQSLLSTEFVAVADAAKANLLATGIPEKKITVILNGSDPIRPVAKQDLSVLRSRLAFPENAFVAGICARLEPYKDHETFLRAAKKCCERDRNIFFLIVGGGSEQSRLQELSRKLGISDRVRFTGFVDDPAPYYRLFSVNVNCSIGTETSCLAISEGYSIGLPAVVSDFGGNPAMVAEGQTGFVVPQRNADAFAEKLLYLKQNPEKYQVLSENAISRYRKKYTASGMTKALEAVYLNLLAQTRIRARIEVTNKK